ncbi:hypothetical protein VDGD_20652 [Verticillium dahliae]|nr:hypothetical protein VDGD_20652 [Verticillium dahliae]
MEEAIAEYEPYDRLLEGEEEGVSGKSARGTEEVLFNLNLITLSRRRWTPKGTRYPGRGPIGRPSSRVSRHLAGPSEDNAAQKKAAAEARRPKPPRRGAL